MKNLILIILCAGVFYYFYSYEGTVSNFVAPQHADAQRSGKGIKQVKFTTLFDQKKPFSSLASNKHYTVVEVYLEPIVRNRKDVVIQRVHMPESGMSFTFSSPQEAEQIQQRMESYQVCSVPHVEIYGPGRKVVSADNCKSKEGTRFLQQWIRAETGLSRLSL